MNLSVQVSASESDRKIEDESNQCNSNGKCKSHTETNQGPDPSETLWMEIYRFFFQQFSWCLPGVGRTLEHAPKRLDVWSWSSWSLSFFEWPRLRFLRYIIVYHVYICVSYVDMLLIMFVWQTMTQSCLISLWKLCATSCPIRIFVNEIIHSGRATTAPSLG